MLEVLFVWGTIGFCAALHISCNQQYERLPLLHNAYVPWVGETYLKLIELTSQYI
jgi:hypothetical protein